MASIRDWASEAAEHISLEFLIQFGDVSRQKKTERIAAIIATFAEPLMALVREARRYHYHCDDSWYCCGKCTHPDHVVCVSLDEDHEHDAGCYLGSHGGDSARKSGVCNCGADAWNARVDAALAGKSGASG